MNGGSPRAVNPAPAPAPAPGPAAETGRPVLAAAVAALLWSTGGLFIKLAPMPAQVVVLGRAVVTAAFFIILLRPRLRDARWSTAACYAAMIITFVTATKITTAAHAIFLQYTGPAYVLLLSPLLLREPIRRADVIAVLVSLGGMTLILVDSMDTGGRRLGAGIALLSGVFGSSWAWVSARVSGPWWGGRWSWGA